MKKRFALSLLALISAGILCASAFAEEATNGRERFFLKRQNCPWTQEMGKFIYECVKKNDGFNSVPTSASTFSLRSLPDTTSPSRVIVILPGATARSVSMS